MSNVKFIQCQEKGSYELLLFNVHTAAIRDFNTQLKFKTKCREWMCFQIIERNSGLKVVCGLNECMNEAKGSAVMRQICQINDPFVSL